MRHIYADFVDRVAKPMRYLGGEYQSVVKDGPVDGRVTIQSKQPVSAEEAVKRIDMGSHKDRYPPNTNLGVNLLGVQRMYELLEGRR